MTVMMPETEEMIAPIDMTELFPYDELDDPNHRTHIVRPVENPELDGPGVTAQDIVDQARLMHLEVVALCGYTWVPKHDPEKFDLCERCGKIAQMLMRQAGE